MIKLLSRDFIKLYVNNGEILPNDVDEINDNLFLNSQYLTEIKNLPKIINGDLYLMYNNIAVVENLPIIKGSLFLDYNMIKEIKCHFDVGGGISITNNPIRINYNRAIYKNTKELNDYVMRKKLELIVND